MADWGDIEDAIHAWIVAGSGLNASQVIWATQDGPQPQSRPFVTIRIGDLIALGAHDEAIIVDHTGDLTPPDPGEELEERVVGVREFGVSVQVFSDAKVGAASGRYYASRIQTALALPAVRFALNEVGLSPFDAGRVREISAILDSAFEARFLLEARFYVVEELSEYETYISHVEVTDEGAEPDVTYMLDIEE